MNLFASESSFDRPLRMPRRKLRSRVVHHTKDPTAKDRLTLMASLANKGTCCAIVTVSLQQVDSQNDSKELRGSMLNSLSLFLLLF